MHTNTVGKSKRAVPELFFTTVAVGFTLTPVAIRRHHTTSTATITKPISTEKRHRFICCGQIVELGDWVPWEFQSEDQEAPSKSEKPDEIVPSPPPCKGDNEAPSGEESLPDGEKGTLKTTTDDGEEVDKAKLAGLQQGEVCRVAFCVLVVLL